jgi:hypothetical protein
MNIPVAPANQAYWDQTAENYDSIFSETVIGRVQRDAVWRELDKNFQPGMRILELNWKSRNSTKSPTASASSST